MKQAVALHRQELKDRMVPNQTPKSSDLQPNWLVAPNVAVNVAVNVIEKIHAALVKRFYEQDAYVIPLDASAPDFIVRIQGISSARKTLAPWTLAPFKTSDKDLIARKRSTLMKLMTWALNLYRARRIKELKAAEAVYFSPAAIEARIKKAQ